MSDTKDFYERQLARMHDELAKKEQQLNNEIDYVNQGKIKDGCLQILSEIDILEKLKAANTKKESKILNINDFRTVLRKIDFQEARDIAENLRSQFKKQDLGAAVLILQKTHKQMGEYCLDEMLTEIFKSDTPIQNIFSDTKFQGNHKIYTVGGDDAQERTALGFLRKIAETDGVLNSGDPLEINQAFRQSLCETLRSGDRILILVKDFHLSKDPQGFVDFTDWFLQDFWQVLLQEIEQKVLPERRYINIIAVLTSASAIDENCLKNICLGDTAEFSPYRPINVPLPDWREEDIEKWLMNTQQMSQSESREKVSSIYEGSEGTPQAICLTLERMAHEQRI